MRYTTHYSIPGTDTLRLSARALWKRPPFKGYGSNSQNFEKKLRKHFVPDFGVFLQRDQSGAEALIVAYEMPPDNKLRQLFENKIKPHVYLGVFFPEHWAKDFPFVGELASLSIPQLKVDPRWPALAKAIAASDNNPSESRYYYLYKQTCHSANYGIRASTFVDNLLLKSAGTVRLTKQQGEVYLEKYHAVIPEIRSHFHRQIIEEYQKTGAIRNLQGFPMTITGVIRESDHQKLFAKKPQSTVGTITNIAYTQMQWYIEDHNKNWDLLANTHDSFLVQCAEEEAPECDAKMKEYLEPELISNKGEKYRMRSEAAMGRNWCPYHPEKNPQGLKEIAFN